MIDAHGVCVQMNCSSVESRSAKFICWASFVRWRQYASSRMSPCLSNTMPVANELASTYAFNSSLDMLQFPRTGSSRVTLASTSSMIRLGEASSARSSHLLITAVTHLFRTLAIMHSQPQTGKWPTNFPHMENMVWRVISAGGSGITVPCSPQTLRPSTLAPCFRCSGSSQVKSKDSNFTLTSPADITSSFTYMSLM